MLLNIKYISSFFAGLLFTLSLVGCGSGEGGDSSSTGTTQTDSTKSLDRAYYGLWRYVDNGEELLITSKTKLDYAVENSDLLKVTQGTSRRYIIRASVAYATITGRLLIEENGVTRSLRGNGYSAAGGIDVIMQNIFDPSLKGKTTTDSSGGINDNTQPSGTVVEISATTDDGKIFKTEVPINSSTVDIGVNVLKDVNDYNFKASIKTNEEFLYGVNKTHKASLIIKNIGNVEGTDVGYKIYQGENLIKSGISGTIGSGETKTIEVEFTTQSITQSMSNLEFTIEMSDSNGRTWSDTVNLDVHRECFDVNVKSAGAAIKGYIVLPNGNVENINIVGDGTISLPTTNDPYSLILSNSDKSSDQNVYTLGVGMDAPPIDSTFSNTAAHEPNNDKTNASTLNYYSHETSYLGYGDIDYWLINSPTTSIGNASLCGNAAPVANAGADQTITEGTAVTLNDSASSDSDGSIVSYKWSENGTTLSTSSSFTKSDFSVGIHTITLTVTDNNGATNTDSILVTVNNIIHKSITYKAVTSPYTGRVWLDRNLGASKACTVLDDEACYGDYYQWGRNADGHEKSTSNTTSIHATNINNAGVKFITSSNGVYGYDWTYYVDNDGSLRYFNWSKTDGSSICPARYRVPTVDELEAEIIVNNSDVFNNFLNFPLAGYRNNEIGNTDYQGLAGIVWSSSVENGSAWSLLFTSDKVTKASYHFTPGLSVRCIKDNK